MKGKIIDMNKTDAYICFDDGSMINISLCHLPHNCKIGNTVNISPQNNIQFSNDKMPNLL